MGRSPFLSWVQVSLPRNWVARGWPGTECSQVCVLSHFSRVRLFVTPWTVAHQALFMGFSRQEYWSGLPCPPPRDLPAPRTEPVSFMSPALVGFFATSACSQAQCSPMLVLLDVRGKMWKCPLYTPFPSPTSRNGLGPGALCCSGCTWTNVSLSNTCKETITD